MLRPHAETMLCAHASPMLRPCFAHAEPVLCMPGARRGARHCSAPTRFPHFTMCAHEDSKDCGLWFHPKRCSLPEGQQGLRGLEKKMGKNDAPCPRARGPRAGPEQRRRPPATHFPQLEFIVKL